MDGEPDARAGVKRRKGRGSQVLIGLRKVQISAIAHLILSARRLTTPAETRAVSACVGSSHDKLHYCLQKLGLRVETLRLYLHRVTDNLHKERIADLLSQASPELSHVLDTILVAVGRAQGISSAAPASPSMYCHELIDKAAEVCMLAPQKQILHPSFSPCHPKA